MQSPLPIKQSYLPETPILYTSGKGDTNTSSIKIPVSLTPYETSVRYIKFLASVVVDMEMRYCPPVGPEKQLTVTVEEKAQDTGSVGSFSDFVCG
jgi:hypothetical protein